MGVVGLRRPGLIVVEGTSSRKHRPPQPARGSHDGMKHQEPRPLEEGELHLGLVHQEVC